MSGRTYSADDVRQLEETIVSLCRDTNQFSEEVRRLRGPFRRAELAGRALNFLGAVLWFAGAVLYASRIALELSR